MKIANTDELRLVVEAARLGSLTAAARTMQTSPAGASAMLKRLEAQLGVRLFERSTRAMRLTSEGQTLLDYATRALELMEEGQLQITAQSGTLVGTIRVAAPSDLTRSVLLPWFGEFLAAHPQVRLALSVSDRVQDVMRDAVDVALRYGALSDSGLVARPLYASRRVLCAAPEYLAAHPAPQHPRDLAQHNCLCFHVSGRRLARWRFEHAGDWTEVEVDGDRSVDDAAIAHQWALAGAGLVCKSELDMVHDLAAGRLVRVMHDWHGEHYPLNAVLPSNRFVPQRVRALVDHLARSFAGLQSPASH